LSAEELRKKIEVTEELLQEEYAIYLESFDNSIRKTVSHLMINIDGDTTADDALILAQGLVSEIKEGSNFTDLVKKYSDDEGTKDTGGDLGVTDGSVLPPEFENAIASMKEGEISLPVELEDSVHLLMVTKIQKPVALTYENKRDLISDTIKEDLANNEFIELLDQISDLTFSLNQIDAIGKEFNLLVQSADYFSKDSAPQNLDKNKILELLFENVEFINNPSVELIETGEGEAFVLYLEDYKPETIKPFEQVKSEAEEYYKVKLAQLELDVTIKKIVESLDQGIDFSKIADDQAVTLKSYKDISRTSSLLSRPVVYDIFNLARANIKIAHGASRLENGDAIIYKLKAVNEKQSKTTTEEKEAFKGFINEERNISELSELQVTSQNAAVIIRKF
jgi:peptidyl-prolyl cis-trans isomerase D